MSERSTVWVVTGSDPHSNIEAAAGYFATEREARAQAEALNASVARQHEEEDAYSRGRWGDAAAAWACTLDEYREIHGVGPYGVTSFVLDEAFPAGPIWIAVDAVGSSDEDRVATSLEAADSDVAALNQASWESYLVSGERERGTSFAEWRPGNYQGPFRALEIHPGTVDSTG